MDTPDSSGSPGSGLKNDLKNKRDAKEVEIPVVTEGPEALFTCPGRFSDVTLKVEGGKLYASRFLLAAVSPVFDAMFTHDFKERSAEEIELPGKKYQDVLELLLQIHPSLRKPVTADLALQLFPLCHEYQMQVEENRCRDVILKRLRQTPLSAEFHRSCVELTCIFDLPDIHEVCVKVSMENPQAYFDPFLDKLEDMPVSNIRVLLTKMRVKIEGMAPKPQAVTNASAPFGCPFSTSTGPNWSFGTGTR